MLLMAPSSCVSTVLKSPCTEVLPGLERLQRGEEHSGAKLGSLGRGDAF